MHNISIEEFEKKINTKFLNNEKNWWTEHLVSEYQELGNGRLFEGEYGMTYIFPQTTNLDIVGYYDVTFNGNQYNFSPELKTIKDTKILDIINQNDKYANLDKYLNVNELESIGDVNKMIAQLEETQMKVRNNREYDLYGGLIDSLGELKKELQNQSTDTTDYSNVRGIA